MLQPGQFGEPAQWKDPKPYFTKGGVGKLFPDQKPSDDVRYVDGYTPERMAEVKDATAGKLVAGGSDSGAQARGVDWMERTLARSTAPPSSLRGGVYAPDALDGPDFADPDFALMHEVGHQDAGRRGFVPTLTNRGDYTPASAGQDEAYADMFAERHLTRRRNDQRPTARTSLLSSGGYATRNHPSMTRDASFSQTFDNAYEKTFRKAGVVPGAARPGSVEQRKREGPREDPTLSGGLPLPWRTY